MNLDTRMIIFLNLIIYQILYNFVGPLMAALPMEKMKTLTRKTENLILSYNTMTIIMLN